MVSIQSIKNLYFYRINITSKCYNHSYNMLYKWQLRRSTKKNNNKIKLLYLVHSLSCCHFFGAIVFGAPELWFVIFLHYHFYIFGVLGSALPPRPISPPSFHLPPTSESIPYMNGWDEYICQSEFDDFCVTHVYTFFPNSHFLFFCFFVFKSYWSTSWKKSHHINLSIP